MISLPATAERSGASLLRRLNGTGLLGFNRCLFNHGCYLGHHCHPNYILLLIEKLKGSQIWVQMKGCRLYVNR